MNKIGEIRINEKRNKGSVKNLKDANNGKYVAHFRKGEGVVQYSSSASNHCFGNEYSVYRNFLAVYAP